MKQTIRLNENELKQLIKESVKTLLKEEDQDYDVRERFNEVSKFSEGFAQVELNGKWNFIDEAGNILSPSQWFDYTQDFDDGIACVGIGNKENIIDRNGNLLSPNQWFDEVWTGVDGDPSMIELNYKYNYMKANGELLFPDQWFDGATTFDYNGYARVVLNGKDCIIYRNGTLCDKHGYPIDKKDLSNMVADILKRGEKQGKFKYEKGKGWSKANINESISRAIRKVLG